MLSIAKFTYRDILGFQDTLRSALRDSTSLEQAAQRITDTVWETFSDTAVLTRCFVTVPYQSLPLSDQGFVQRSLKHTGAAESIPANSIVLSLMGTRGRQPEWNNRKLSRDHLGIPLVSTGFIEEIPMLSRLLQELGVDPGWFHLERGGFTESKLGAGQVGVFFVQDATGAIDAQGRLIISAQEFVQEYGVKSVFGLGGVYGDGTVLILLVFTQELLEKTQVNALTHLIVLIKSATADLLKAGALFAVPE